MIDKFFAERLRKVILTDEKIDQVKRYVKRNKEWLDITHYTNSPIPGCLVPALLEIAKHFGIINPTQRHLYAQAQYTFEALSETKDKVTKFIKALKIIV